MALQANVLEDGSWVTENVTIQAILSAREQPSAAEPEESLPPECGLLTRTVIESPVVQWIFPARIRSPAHNDVAFIGDRFVQIRELGDDGQLHDVARKVDFESRIRNARVLGSFYEDSFIGDVHETASERLVNPPGMDLGQDPLHSEAPERHPLPPQLLVIVLESGQIVFLFLRKPRQGPCEFVASSVEPPRKERLVHPGFHLAIDPSSRYIVTATCEGLFVVHELEPFDTLNRQLQATGTITPIVASRSRALNGIIHKAEFLFPGSANQDTVILVLVVVRKGASRLITYEWAHGDDLRSALLEDMTGLKLPPEHKMPLLLIPLTVKTAFLSVSENSIAVFRDALHGSSNPEVVNTKPLRQTEYHHGHAKPLWTAWTRPFRRKAYYESKDNIYLAREDGMIFFFEVNSDEILESSLDVGDYKTNISTAFATVADTFSDIFILGGSCGDGSIWVLHARESPAQIGTIPNWSPALDLVTTDRFLTWNETRGSDGSNGSAMKPWNELTPSDHTEHDRVFATSGRGVNGSITEFMSGVKANITIDVEYGSALGHVWVFSTPGGGTSAGSTVLLALHGQSAVVELTPDLGGLRDHDISEMGFDTSARTLAASQFSDGTICQVTEAAIVLLLGHTQRSHHTIADIIGGLDSRAENACIGASVVAFTSLSMQPTPGYEVYVVATSSPGAVLRRHIIEHEVTCLGLCTIGTGDFLAVAVWQLDQTALLFYDTNGSESEPALVFPMSLPGLNEAAGDGTSPIEAITTLVVVHQSAEKTVIVGGTRGGYFLQLEMALVVERVEVTRFSIEKLGRLPLEVLPTTSSPTTHQNSVFLCCDSAVVLLEEYDVKGTKGFGLRHRVVPMDPGSEKAECLQVASIAKIPGGSATDVPVLVLTGSRLLVANLEPHSGIISRRLPLGGTPLRLMYSQALRCLVVAATVKDRPTLIFMDPDTGENLSQPTDRSGGEAQEFITGLGHEGDWIHSLCEWSYTKDESTFLYILVTTNSGRLLVVSATRVGGVVKFWTRHKRSIQDTPVYAVCAEADNIFFCAGSAVYWNKLDAVERRIKDYATIGLVSPATALSITGRKLYALTQAHSLEVIDLDMVEKKEDIRTVGGGLMEQRTRPASHMIDVGDLANGSPPWPITLLSDRECGVVGAWVPKKGDGQEVTIVLEAELPASVRRFRRGHTRPPWWRSRAGQPRYGRIPSTVDDAEVLGICLDGSMQHFTLLSIEAWRFLRLVQDAASENRHYDAVDSSEARRVILPRPSTHPKTQLQVNGDILQSVLANKNLKQLFGDSRNLRLFKRYLDRLDNGEWSRDFMEPGSTSDTYSDDDLDEVDSEDGTVDMGINWDSTTARYLELGYDVLGYFLRPVL